MATSTQMVLPAQRRPETGKGAAGRLRRTGRAPAVLYGHGVDPATVSVDVLELYHVLHTEAGVNVLIRLQVDGEEYLTVARDIQRHAVRGDYVHLDFYAVDRDQPITVEIPVHLHNEEDPKKAGGVVNQVLSTVTIKVKPLEVPTAFDLDLTGLEIGDVKRVEDLDLPAGAEWGIDAEETVVTINAPMREVEELEAAEEEAALEQALEAAGELPEDEAEAAEAEEEPAEESGTGE